MNKMVEVFKTNVQEDSTASLVEQLLEHFPQSKINFDLEDCDKILRVEGSNVIPGKVIDILMMQGYLCSVLE